MAKAAAPPEQEEPLTATPVQLSRGWFRTMLDDWSARSPELVTYLTSEQAREEHRAAFPAEAAPWDSVHVKLDAAVAAQVAGAEEDRAWIRSLYPPARRSHARPPLPAAIVVGDGPPPAFLAAP